MAEEGIFCSGAHVLRKAGSGASSTSSAQAYYNDFITQAESFINTATRYNWSDNYSSLNVDVKEILKECASCLAAIYVIQYDMSGYTSRSEAQTMLDVLNDRAQKCISLLDDEKKRLFVQGG